MSIYCNLVVTCWEMADLLALLCVTFSCSFVTLPCGFLGQAWYLILLVPDLCLLSYFQRTNMTSRSKVKVLRIGPTARNMNCSIL